MIDGSVFDCCSSLIAVCFPARIALVRSYAFSTCTGLRHITIEAVCTTIEAHAFQGCSGLTLTVPAGHARIEAGAFDLGSIVRLVLFGDVVAPAVERDLGRCLLPTAAVVCPEMAGRHFGACGRVVISAS
jgi:hypothetical protein